MGGEKHSGVLFGGLNIYIYIMLSLYIMKTKGAPAFLLAAPKRAPSLSPSVARAR